MAAVLCLALLSGCAHVPTTQPVSIAVRAAAPLVAAPTATQAAISHIHTLPLYQQAEQACRNKQYAQAAALLQRLSRQSGLNEEEVAFVQQQRTVCLQDAGLPLPTQSRVSPAPSPKFVGAQSPGSVSTADCGPRALLLACQSLGVKTSLEALCKAAGTTGQGTSLAGLAVAAKRVGVKAEGVQVSRDALPDIDVPAVAYVNNNHFIAVLAVQGKGESGTAILHDPNSPQEETCSQERLLRLCSGYLLLLHK